MKKFFKILVLAVFFINQTGVAVFAEEFEKSSSHDETHQEHSNSENEHNDHEQSVSEEKNSSEDHEHKEDREEKTEFHHNNENENNDHEQNERRGKNDDKKSESDEEHEHNDGDKDHIDNKHESEEESSDEDSGDEEESDSGDSEEDQEQIGDEGDTDGQEDQDDESQEENHDQDQDDNDDNQEYRYRESVIEETETIDVYVLTTDQTLFKDEVTFSKCSSFEGQVEDFYAYCALEQIDPSSLWTFYESFGNSAFLDQIFDIHSPEDWSAFWAYFKNRQEGVLALNKDVFSDGDELLVTLGAMPISLATTTDAVVGATTTIQARYFGYDESFSPTYFDLADADIYLDDEFVGTTTSEGLFDFVADTAGDNIFEAKKDGFADSLPFLVTFVDSEEGGIGGDNSDSGSGGGSSDSDKKTLDVEALLNFLDSKQKDDGSFGSDLYTDWAAVAYGSQSRHSTAKEKLKTFLISDNLQGGSVTDYERRAMALMALGINPYTEAKENYIQKIYDSFDGTQFGDSSLVNDDIFAVLVLRNVGFTGSDVEIQKAIEFIISKQSSSGSIDSPDLTSAGIQALKLGDSNSNTTSAINKAVNYLKSSQQSDGGFNDSFATSWIIIGLIAGGESPSSLEKNGNSPFDYLANLQQTDGGLEETSKDLDTRVWTSSYAVSAGLQKTWDDILKNFSKKVTEKNEDSSDERNASNPTVDVATTTEGLVSEDGIPSTPTVLGASISNDAELPGFTGSSLEEETEVEEVLPETQENATTTEGQMPVEDSKNNNIYIWILIIAGVVVIVRIIRWKKD